MDEESIYATRRLESEESEPVEEEQTSEETPLAPPPLPEAEAASPPPLPSEVEGPPPLPEGDTLMVMTPPTEGAVEAAEVTPTYQPETVMSEPDDVADAPEIPSPFDEAEAASASEPAPVDASPVTPASATPPPVTPSSGGGQQPPVTPAGSEAKPPKKNNTTLIIVLIVAALLLLCCCCVLIGGVLYPIVDEIRYMWLLQGVLGLL